MKNVFFIFLVLFSFNLNAQLNVWKNFGINYSTINTPNHKTFNITPKYGINAGVAFPNSFNKFFAIEPEVNIAQKGAILVGKNFEASRYFDEYNIKSTYLELPVSLRTTIGYKNVAYLLKIGYYLDINIWTNSVIKSGSTVGHLVGPNFLRPFDHGIQGGIGVEINKKISIQGRLFYGLYNITNFYNSNEFYSNYVINLSVGYKFKKKPNDKQCSK